MAGKEVSGSFQFWQIGAPTWRNCLLVVACPWGNGPRITWAPEMSCPGKTKKAFISCRKGPGILGNDVCGSHVSWVSAKWLGKRIPETLIFGELVSLPGAIASL